MIKETSQDDAVILHTVNWIKSVVIGCNFCPFAAKALNQKSIRYRVLPPAGNFLSALLAEYKALDRDAFTETTFLIFPHSLSVFEDYLDALHKAERSLSKEKYKGVYQLASFHPRYCFAGSDENDAANYTNRSVYPMLQILREDSISKVLKHFDHPQNIPGNNIEFARKKGLEYMSLLRAACIG